LLFIPLIILKLQSEDIFLAQREKKGIIVAFSFTSGAYNEVHRVGFEGNIKIELKTVEELLNDT